MENIGATRLLELVKSKESNICLSCDKTNSSSILELAEKLGSEIVLLKTHVDIISDFSTDFIGELRKISKKNEFMLFEDRKFADIGNTVKMQFEAGIYKIKDWADFVTVHVVSGPGIIDTFSKIMNEEQGVFVLSQMTSKNSLMDEEYARKAVNFHNKIVVGYIGNGSNPSQLRKLKLLVRDRALVLTPGIRIGATKDSLDQQYGTPQEAIKAGADILVIGRAITESGNPLKTAGDYRKIAWHEFRKRL